MSVTCNIVSSRTSMDAKGKEFTVFGISVECEGNNWTLEKRYSEFHNFSQDLADATRGIYISCSISI